MSDSTLRRYTNIPALIHLLTEQKITLLDPQSWDDKNDSRYLDIYRQKKGLASVLALCFTQAGESYHHWRVFADGSSGVCIQFAKSPLIKAVKSEVRVRTGAVRYLKLKELREAPPRIHELSFLKRFAFEHEKEFRMICESRDQRRATLDVAIPLSTIDRITLSPWLDQNLATPLRHALKSIKGCSNVEIVRSTLIGNREWQEHGESAE